MSKLIISVVGNNQQDTPFFCLPHTPEMTISPWIEDWRLMVLIGGGLGLLCAMASHYWLERRFYQRRVAQ